MIYKGCEKRMIMLKNTGSELFEEAYFILNTKKSNTVTSNDMIKEANRIISDNNIVMPKQRNQKYGIIQYLIGFLSGAGVVGLVMTLVI